VQAGAWELPSPPAEEEEAEGACGSVKRAADPLWRKSDRAEARRADFLVCLPPLRTEMTLVVGLELARARP
jgi:hypothetical protein